MTTTPHSQSQWPELDFYQLKDTITTVQLWAQIVGKIRLRKMPWLNHSWHVSLYVFPKGLTTGPVPYQSGIFQIDFDFIEHQLAIFTSAGVSAKINLYPRTVADFYRALFQQLDELGIDAEIYAKPNEMDPAIPFAKDEVHADYNAEQMNLYWQALARVHVVFTKFRAGFIGKVSPVHLYWGGFDLAVTRFSGRTAPPHPGGMPNMPLKVMQESYSHEVSSCGFWAGNEQSPFPAFYSYCYPTPADFGEQPVEPSAAFFSKEMGEFFLPYDVVRNASDPEAVLLPFLRSTYAAAANTAHWDREALEFDFSEFER
jgi:hypothetical protein